MPHGLACAEAADRLAVHLHIRDDIDFREALDEAPAILLHWRPVEIAEAAAEGDQILVGQVLSADQQYGMSVEGAKHGGEGRVVQLPEIDIADLGSQRPVRRNNLDIG